jgi:hypothetical protein
LITAGVFKKEFIQLSLSQSNTEHGRIDVIPGVPTKMSTAVKCGTSGFSEASKLIVASTPIKFRHLPTLTSFMREQRLRFFNPDDRILNSEKSFWKMQDDWKLHNPWEEQVPRISKAAHAKNMRKRIEGSCQELEILDCRGWEGICVESC